MVVGSCKGVEKAEVCCGFLTKHHHVLACIRKADSRGLWRHPDLLNSGSQVSTWEWAPWRRYAECEWQIRARKTHRDTKEERMSLGVLWLQKHQPLPFWDTFPFASLFQTVGLRGTRGSREDN